MHFKNSLTSILALVDRKSRIDPNAKLHRLTRVRNSTVGRYSYIGPNTRLENTDIGSFCSISWDCLIGLSSHGLSHVSTSPIFFEKHNATGFTWVATDSEKCPVRRTQVGNDVWIGVNSIILEGVKVGDGAVVGAGAVVTKDVPPYTIVGGVPAKFIKARFPENIVLALLEKRWWDAPEDEIRRSLNIFQIYEPMLTDIAKLPQGRC